MKQGLAIGLGALCLLLAGAASAALAPPTVLPIAGLAGPSIQVAGAQRTNDGGAILAARIAGRLGAERGRIVAVRLLADGALSLAYGTRGVATLAVDARLQPTSLAVDPATGDAWIGTRVGQRGPSEIIALDGAGAPRRSFGTRGVLRLPAADDGGPVALAWRGGSLLIAAGDAPCRGCSVSLRDPARGRLLASTVLSSGELAPTGCSGMPAIASGVFVGGHVELTTRAPARSKCPALIVTLGLNLRPVGSSGPPAPSPLAAPATSLVLSTSGADSCIAGTDGSRIAVAPYSRGTSAAAAAPAGTLIALVPLGAGSCAALVDTLRGRATVAQMSAGNRRAVTDGLPRGIGALAMFRCHQHLLVVGATGRREKTAVVVPVAIRRGAFAARAFPAASTGCR